MSGDRPTKEKMESICFNNTTDLGRLTILYRHPVSSLLFSQDCSDLIPWFIGHIQHLASLRDTQHIFFRAQFVIDQN